MKKIIALLALGTIGLAGCGKSEPQTTTTTVTAKVKGIATTPEVKAIINAAATTTANQRYVPKPLPRNGWPDYGSRGGTDYGLCVTDYIIDTIPYEGSDTDLSEEVGEQAANACVAWWEPTS